MRQGFHDYIGKIWSKFENGTVAHKLIQTLIQNIYIMYYCILLHT